MLCQASWHQLDQQLRLRPQPLLLLQLLLLGRQQEGRVNPAEAAPGPKNRAMGALLGTSRARRLGATAGPKSRRRPTMWTGSSTRPAHAGPVARLLRGLAPDAAAVAATAGGEAAADPGEGKHRSRDGASDRRQHPLHLPLVLRRPRRKSTMASRASSASGVLLWVRGSTAETARTSTSARAATRSVARCTTRSIASLLSSASLLMTTTGRAATDEAAPRGDRRSHRQKRSRCA